MAPYCSMTMNFLAREANMIVSHLGHTAMRRPAPPGAPVHNEDQLTSAGRMLYIDFSRFCYGWDE